MGRKKIVLIGAGSAMFTQGLIADLIQNPGLGPWELALVDTDPEALAIVGALSERMLKSPMAGGSDISLSYSTDRCDVLAGADYVVSTIAVGKRRAWEADVFIPRRYGIYQPVGDTVMPGGISRALRMIPPMVDIARDIQRLSPCAVFFNYANPMTANCSAVIKATGLPVIGLCHGVHDTARYVAGVAGLDPSRTTALAAGLNHLTFLFDFRFDGADAWPLVKQNLDGRRNENPFSWSIFDTYGVYPSASDRHVTEFFPERFPKGCYHGKTLGIDAFSFEDTIAWGDRIYEDMGKQASGEIPLNGRLFARGPGEHEQLLDIIESLEKGANKIFSINTVNGGSVPNLPWDSVLEIPAVTAGGKFRALKIADFPDILASIIARRLVSVNLTVEAALKGDRKLFVEAILADGAVTDPQEASKLADELLRAQAPYLPQFA